MSSQKLTKPHSENLSNNQIRLNGLSHKRSLTKQEEVDLTPEHHNHHPTETEERSVKTVHSISICINNFEENSSEENMRQEIVRDVSEDTETNYLADGVKEIQIEDKELRQSVDNTSALPLNDHCDAKDKKRTKHLVRGEAVRESSLSPPPEASLDENEVIKNSSLNKSSSNSNSAASSPSLSRDSSTENNLECSGAELLAFLTESLKKSQKDRMYLLRIEQEILQLIKDSSKESHKINASSSYNRMLIHRVAAYFGLEHTVDHTHTSVIVTKTKGAHIPELKLKELIKDDESTDEPKKLILKRDSTSLEDSSGSSFDKDRSPESHLNGSLSDSSRSRSLEEREENYERVRARIFNNSNNSSINEEQKASLQTSPSSGACSPSASNTKAATETTSESKVATVSTEGEEKEKVKVASVDASSTLPITASSLETESHSDCDTTKDALLPSNTAAATAVEVSPVATGATKTLSSDATISSNSANKSSSNSNSQTNENAKRPSGHSNGRYDGNNSNRGRYGGNVRNRGYSEQSGSGYHRYSQSRKMDSGRGGGGDNGDWSLKPNLNTKLASQNMPYNFFYPNVVDGGPYGHRPFPPTLNHHAPVANQFSLGGNPYMQSPLLSNEQLFPPVNYVNPSMLPLVSSNQANVPNSMCNQISYSHNGAHSSPSFLSSNNLSMPNNYQQFMYNSIQAQSMCGTANGVPYSPQGGHNQLAPAPANAYNSLMAMSPYQQQVAAAYHHHQQAQTHHAPTGGPIPLSSLMAGSQLPPNYKPPTMNDYEKACQQQLKSAAGNYGKVAPSLHPQSSAVAAQMNSHHHYPLAPAGQFSCPPEVLDRSLLGQVQFNAAASHELMMNSARAGGLHPGAGPPPFALNYGGNKSRYVPNDVLLGNPNQLSQQAQTAMYLSHHQQQMHQQKQYGYGSNNNKPNGAGGNGGGKFSNGGRGNGRRGGGNGGGGGHNPNRKY